MRSHKTGGAIPREVPKTPFGDRKNTLHPNSSISISTPMKAFSTKKINNFHKPELTPLRTPLVKLQKQHNHKSIKSNVEIPIKPNTKILPTEPILFTDADIDKILNGKMIQARTPIPPPTPPPLFDNFDLLLTIGNDDDTNVFNFNDFHFNANKLNGFGDNKYDDDNDDLPPLFQDSNDEQFKCYF